MNRIEVVTRPEHAITGEVRRQLPEGQPQWTARKGAVQLRDAYQRVGITLQDFEGPRFRRIDLLKRLMSESKVDNTLRWTHAVTS